MVQVPSAASGDLKRVDVLRQLYQHDRALDCLDALVREGVAEAESQDGIALRLRILRALRRFDEANDLLSGLPAGDDDAPLRENRIAVWHRCGRGHDALALSPDPIADQLGDRVLVALARIHASNGDVGHRLPAAGGALPGPPFGVEYGHRRVAPARRRVRLVAALPAAPR